MVSSGYRKGAGEQGGGGCEGAVSREEHPKWVSFLHHQFGLWWKKNPEKDHCYWGLESSARQDDPKAAAVKGRIWVDLWKLGVQPLLSFGLYLVTWGTLLQSNLDILGPLFYELLASIYKIPLRQEGKQGKLWNNSLISHSRPHEVHNCDSRSPCGVRKLNPHFCAVMAKLTSSTSSQPLRALAHLGATWGVWNNVLSLLLGHGEASSQGRNVKAATQMLLPHWGRQSLLSLLSLKLQNKLSDLCMEQYYVSFHCVQTFLLLKMLHLMERLVLKATTFFSVINAERDQVNSLPV